MMKSAIEFLYRPSNYVGDSERTLRYIINSINRTKLLDVIIIRGIFHHLDLKNKLKTDGGVSFRLIGMCLNAFKPNFNIYVKHNSDLILRVK